MDFQELKSKKVYPGLSLYKNERRQMFRFEKTRGKFVQ
jgi:hypothetical protein